jgi:hypothetical protein
MVAVAMAILAAAAAFDSTRDRPKGDSVQSLLREESPDVFLAKATLQQYLARIVRREWDGVMRLTHPLARLSPWAEKNDELKTYEFRRARSVGPGAVLVEVGEDVYHRDSQDMSTDDPAVYVLFKSGGSWLIRDRRPGVRLRNLSDDSVRASYPGWTNHQAYARERAEARLARKQLLAARREARQARIARNARRAAAEGLHRSSADVESPVLLKSQTAQANLHP